MRLFCTPPFTEEQMRALSVGDVVLISGEMFTGRDQVHAYLMKNAPPVDLNGAALYHCGPVMLKEGERLDGESSRSDHQYPRRAVSGRCDPTLRCTSGHRQGWHGSEDACGAEGVRRSLSERHRRCSAVLCANGGARCWASI